MTEVNTGLTPEELDLKKMLGDRFVDCTGTPKPEKPVRKPQNKIVEPASGNPPAQEKDLFDTLKECCKWLFIFGGLSCLVFYWMHAGLMDESIALPSMLVCTALAGFGVGKSFVGGKV